jgi:predicted nuclease of predicted toxin-antitoxin system
VPCHKRPYFRQKPILYFDENFPGTVVASLKENPKISNCFKIRSVYDFGHETKDDDFQYEFAKRSGFVLVTLDRGFLNDRRYPIQKIPGIIVVAASSNQTSRIARSLSMLASFLALVPFPKAFIGDSKFQVSLEGCVMRGRDAKTREIKTLTITLGHTLSEVAQHFHYFG